MKIARILLILLLPVTSVFAQEGAGDLAASQAGPRQLLDTLNGYPHALVIAVSDAEVVDHEVGLGALQKVRGAWRFKKSERVSGRLQRFTWQVTDGFSSEELFRDLSEQLAALGGSELLFACQGRACGHGSQWANRVFGQKILYGRDDLQRYSVYGFSEPELSRVVIYASSRTSDRHYLHAELIEQTPSSD
ncbi:MAG: DUF4892 domain-containing protein [Halieaceae bacterium]